MLSIEFAFINYIGILLVEKFINYFYILWKKIFEL